MEIQVQAPVGTPIDKIGQAFRTQFSRQGIQVESLQYVGSIDTDFEGIVLPVAEKCATPGCERTVETQKELPPPPAEPETIKATYFVRRNKGGEFKNALANGWNGSSRQRYSIRATVQPWKRARNGSVSKLSST